MPTAKMQRERESTPVLNTATSKRAGKSKAVLGLLALAVAATPCYIYYVKVIQPELRAQQEIATRNAQLENEVWSKFKEPSIGDEVVLDSGGADDVMLGVTESDYGKIIEAFVDKDQDQLRRMESSGRLIRVPNGTKAVLIDTSLGNANVKILRGEKPGRSGWISIERIRNS